MKNYFLVLLALLVSSGIFAQGERKDKTAVTYEELYDEPYSVNKLFVGFQPMYGELFVTNPTAGFGVDVSYYYADKADFKFQYRKTYSQKFFDYARDIADKNSDVDNKTLPFSYIELGGTYHIRDFESSSKTKMFLYKKSYKGNRWAARVPLSADVPCKVRKIYGARLGGITWKSTVDVGRVLEDQGLSNADLIDDEVGAPYRSEDDLDRFAMFDGDGGEEHFRLQSNDIELTLEVVKAPSPVRV